MMWDHDYGSSAGSWVTMSLLMALLLALTGVVVVAALRTLGGRDASRETGSGQGPSEAERLLDERLARGEIDEADYESRRDLLRRSGGAGHGSRHMG